MNLSSIKAVLWLEDNPGDARLIREMFSEPGFPVVDLIHVDRMSEAEQYLQRHSVDLILLDLGLPDAQGLDAVRRMRVAAHHIPLVVLSGMDDELMALQALKEGAQDYLLKGQIEPRELLRALRYAMERKHIEDSLFAEKERAQATLRCIGDAVVSIDILGNIAFLNPVAEEMTLWSLKEAKGRPLEDVLQIVDAATRESIPDLMTRAMVRGETGNFLLNNILIRRDGAEIPVEDSASPIHDSTGQPTGAVLVLRDVSAARAMSRLIAHAAAHDSLTGLPNRLLLNERINHAIKLAKRNQHRVAVLYLDLDGFKHINDSLGHQIGDQILQSVAGRLLDCVRAPDTVSRQGGDEFLVLLSQVDHPDGSASVAERMLQAVTGSHFVGDRELHINGSLGISVYPDDGPDAEALIRAADTAMYQAKEEGRHGFQFFTPMMNARAVERQSIEENLRRAMDHGELELHYQPKVNLGTGEITGAEALIRWNHPTRGLISPAQFIPVAEDCGLILPIGKWVMRQACIQARAWMMAGLPAISMAVNVSALQFRDCQFLDGLLAVLAETELEAKYLELELTESILMKRAELSSPILELLRERGVRVAIDDFGTGYSSLGYLHKFPLDALKIDQSFIRQMTASPNETSIVCAIISMGRSLNLRVIAEGVETVEELAFLQAQCCDEAQGYHFSKAVPPHEFAMLLAGKTFSLP